LEKVIKMSQSGYTPIQIYRSATPAAVPDAANLAAGELAINTADGILFYEDSGGTVKPIAHNITPVANGGTSLTTLTANNVILGNGTSAPLFVAPGTNGNILTSNGTTWTSAAAPSFTQVYPGAGVAVSTGSAWDASITLGTGVSTFLTTPSSANLAAAVTDETGSGALVFANSATLSKPTFNDGYTEEVFAITDGSTVNLDPNNGSIQTWTLGASRTPGQANWAAGQSITLQVDDGTAYTITWSTLAVVWKTDGGVAPTLNTTGFTVIVLWKVGTTIYGARVGDA